MDKISKLIVCFLVGTGLLGLATPALHAQESNLLEYRFTISSGCFPKLETSRSYFGAGIADVIKTNKQTNSCMSIQTFGSNASVATPTLEYFDTPWTFRVITTSQMDSAERNEISHHLEALATSGCPSTIQPHVSSVEVPHSETYLMALKWKNDGWTVDRMKVIKLSGTHFPRFDRSCDGSLENPSAPVSEELTKFLGESAYDFDELALTFKQPSVSNFKKEVFLGSIQSPSIGQAESTHTQTAPATAGKVGGDPN